MRVEVFFKHLGQSSITHSRIINEVYSMSEVHTGRPHIAMSYLNRDGNTTTSSFPTDTVAYINIEKVGEGN